jgi:ComF family protein
MRGLELTQHGSRLLCHWPTLQRWSRWVLPHVLPRDCALCNAPTANAHLCTECQLSLPQLIESPGHSLCARCALPSTSSQDCEGCRVRPFIFDRTLALWPYAYPVDRLVQHLKYHAHLHLADLFAEFLAVQLGSYAKDSNINLVVAVPLARTRLRSRGFNQSLEIARRVARRLDLPIALDAVVRETSTYHQAELPLAARHRNMRGAFVADARLLGCRVAVIDDVMTTGATLEAMAQAIKQAGAVYVENWVIARALLRTPSYIKPT